MVVSYTIGSPHPTVQVFFHKHNVGFEHRKESLYFGFRRGCVLSSCVQAVFLRFPFAFLSSFLDSL